MRLDIGYHVSTLSEHPVSTTAISDLCRLYEDAWVPWSAQPYCAQVAGNSMLKSNTAPRRATNNEALLGWHSPYNVWIRKADSTFKAAGISLVVNVRMYWVVAECEVVEAHIIHKISI